MQKFVHRKESEVRDNNGKNEITENFFSFFEMLSAAFVLLIKYEFRAGFHLLCIWEEN